MPEELEAEASALKDEIVEAAAEGEDELTDRYLRGEDLSPEDIKRGLRSATLSLQAVPVLCGSAFKNKGVQPLLDAVVDYLPSPLDVPPMIGLDADEQEVLCPPEDSAPMAGLAFKIINDPYVGHLTFLRLYAGCLTSGDQVLNATKGHKERIGRLLKMHADKREEIREVFSGDIVAAVGLRNTTTGDTLASAKRPVRLRAIEAPQPVISMAVEPSGREDQDRLSAALGRIAVEDPSLRIEADPETGQTILSGMGELHLEIITDRLRREFKTSVKTGRPQVAFREGVCRQGEAEAKFVRQSGGRGLFGHVKIIVAPLERGEGFVFESKITGGVIPKEFIPAVEKGVREAAAAGVVAGYPVIDVKVELIDGSFHPVDSSDLAFRIAGSMAFKKACHKAEPVLLEPIMKIDIVCPEESIGQVIGDLNSRRGRMSGLETRGSTQVVAAFAPLAGMFGYATDLRSATQGRATFSMQFSHYEPAPAAVVEEVIGQVARKKIA